MTATEDIAETPESAITSLKSWVIRSVKSADQDVVPRSTDYFNNTFAPDIVLEWPKTQEVRHIFLRTRAATDYFIEDLEQLGIGGSIVMALSDVPFDDQQRLQRASLEKKCLVAQPVSFSALGDRSLDEPVVGLASSALLQGGKGFVPPARAIEFGQVLVHGFDSARTSEQDGTATAVVQAEDILDQRQADEITGFLHAVWVGSGGDGTTFPSGRGVTARPTGRALDLLLTTVDIDDRNFWTRMARSLTFAKLADISATTNDVNFQHLMRAATNLLQAKAMRVVDGVPAAHQGARWFMNGGALGLRYRDKTAMFAGSRKGELVAGGVGESPALSTVQLRASRADIALTDVTVGTEARRLDYGSEDGGEITGDSELGRFAEALGPQATVRRATARIGSRDLLVDFESSTISGRTAATYYLSELVEHLPLFADFSRAEIRELFESALGTAADPQQESE